MKKCGAALLCALTVLFSLGGCAGAGGASSAAETSGASVPQSGYAVNSRLSSSGSAHLTLTGMSASFKAMEDVITSFGKLYPGCTVEYEYVQNYSESILTRLAANDSVDLFITNNITADSALLPYALELKSQSAALDLSHTYEGLIRNFTISANGADALYSIPTGGDLRGLYVNKTLLAKYGLQVPADYAGFVRCCETLRKNGYVPLQGNPGSFGQLLMYPRVASLVANASDAKAVRDRVNRCEAGVSELFREPVSRLYDLVKNGYYNYKYIETKEKTFLDGTDDTAARSFLNIVSNGGTAAKADDIGRVAFMPNTMSFGGLLGKMKDDYHSAIDYEFILSPVGDEGGYAYLSPGKGIAVNKDGGSRAWALEFLNYFFTEPVNKTYAAGTGLVPNTPDALSVIEARFPGSGSRTCQLGQVSFDYVFFDVIKKTLTDVSKANNPKYMQADGTMYSLDHYMQALEADFAKHRT